MNDYKWGSGTLVSFDYANFPYRVIVEVMLPGNQHLIHRYCYPSATRLDKGGAKDLICRLGPVPEWLEAPSTYYSLEEWTDGEWRTVWATERQLSIEKDKTPPAPRSIEVSPASEAIGKAVLSTPVPGVHDQSKPVPNSPAKKVAEDCRRMAFQTAKGQNEARVTVTGGSMFALTNTLLSAGNLLEALARCDPGAPAPEGFHKTTVFLPDGRVRVVFEQIEPTIL